MVAISYGKGKSGKLWPPEGESPAAGTWAGTSEDLPDSLSFVWCILGKRAYFSMTRHFILRSGLSKSVPMPPNPVVNPQAVAVEMVDEAGHRSERVRSCSGKALWVAE